MAQRPGTRPYELPPAAPSTNHGKTKAAWTLIWLVTLGALIVGLGMIFSVLWVVILGVVVIIAGLVAGKVLQGMGMGQPADEPDAGRRDRDWYS